MDRNSYRLSDQSAREILGHPETKREYNRRLFSTVAPRYYLATRLLSFGRDQAWKRTLVGMCAEALPAQPRRILDIACGTGDLTLALSSRFPETEVVGVDLNPHMLAEARRRRESAPQSDGLVHFMEGDMTTLPFPDGSFDLVTGGYALRNAPDLAAALGEIRRVLVPQGVLGILDFSRSPRPAVAALSRALLSFWGNLWGIVLHGDGGVYGYIARSLAHFPDRKSLARLLSRAGFPRLTRKLRMFGMLEVIVATEDHRLPTGPPTPSDRPSIGPRE